VTTLTAGTIEGGGQPGLGTRGSRQGEGDLDEVEVPQPCIQSAEAGAVVEMVGNGNVSVHSVP
jgi:hypothetical protein